MPADGSGTSWLDRLASLRDRAAGDRRVVGGRGLDADPQEAELARGREDAQALDAAEHAYTRGALNGASFGFADDAVSAVAPETGAELEQALERDRAEQPAASGLGNFTGGVASGEGAARGAAALGKAALPAAAAAYGAAAPKIQAALGIGRLAAESGAQNAAQAAGDQAQGTPLAERATAAKEAGLFGFGLGGGAAALGAAVPGALRTLKGMIQEGGEPAARALAEGGSAVGGGADRALAPVQEKIANMPEVWQWTPETARDWRATMAGNKDDIARVNEARRGLSPEQDNRLYEWGAGSNSVGTYNPAKGLPEMLDTGELAGMPQVDAGDIYRGRAITPEQAESLLRGGEISRRDLTSWTQEPSTAVRFAEKGAGDAARTQTELTIPNVLHVRGGRGIPVGRGEKEVIADGGKYRVVRNAKHRQPGPRAQDYLYTELEQISGESRMASPPPPPTTPPPAIDDIFPRDTPLPRTPDDEAMRAWVAKHDALDDTERAAREARFAPGREALPNAEEASIKRRDQLDNSRKGTAPPPRRKAQK